MLNVSIRELAMKETTISDVMNEREKIKTEDIQAKFPNGITINDVDLIENVDDDGIVDSYYVYAFKEDKSKFAFAGSVLKRIFDAIWKECGGLEEARKAIAEQGLKVQLSEGRTKVGRAVTLVKVL